MKANPLRQPLSHLRRMSAAVVAGLAVLIARMSNGQVQMSEIMFNPMDDAPWEWIEIHNSSLLPIDLDGWVFGDSESNYAAANIGAGPGGTTVVPAGGIAVIYDAPALGDNPDRFRNAWGPGITLIPVSTFPSLNNGGDRIGLWSSHSNYFVGPGLEPEWSSAEFELDYGASGFPNVAGAGGFSIAWNGTGPIHSPMSWVESSTGQPGVRTAVATLHQLNNTADIGSPGVTPSIGTPPAGKLFFTEIMYNPRSSVGGSSDAAFEWVEIYNNTGATINFAATPHFFDDVAGSALSSPNVNTGSVTQGARAVLFNATLLTADELKSAWEPAAGTTINFIPVSNWPGLDNGPETIGLWSNLSTYTTEHALPPSQWTGAVAAVSYSDNTGQGWPADDGNGSIYLNNLSANPALGVSWTLSGGANDAAGSFHPAPIQRPDHPGGDVGSPGFVPGVTQALAGDYNGDGSINAADYTVWRNNFGQSVLLPGETTPRVLTRADYDLWKDRYIEANQAGGALHQETIPEPAAVIMATIAVAIAALIRPPLRALH
jgi:hypothetical protein